MADLKYKMLTISTCAITVFVLRTISWFCRILHFLC